MSLAASLGECVRMIASSSGVKILPFNAMRFDRSFWKAEIFARVSTVIEAFLPRLMAFTWDGESFLPRFVAALRFLASGFWARATPFRQNRLNHFSLFKPSRSLWLPSFLYLIPRARRHRLTTSILTPHQ